MAKKQDDSLRRLGDTEKCPACGLSIDSSAYHCPRCRIYFCFKCRRRVPRGEPQYQCVDQQCQYYGKLLCKGCTVDVPQIGTVAKRRMVKWPRGIRGSKREIGCISRWAGVVATITFVLGMGAVSDGGLLCYALFAAPFVFCAVVLAADSYCRFSYRRKNIPIDDVQVPAVYEDYSEEEEIARHRCCIACRHPVEHL